MQSTMSKEKSNDAEASDTKEQASHQPIDEGHELKERLDLLNERVKSFIEERPVVCLVGAMALGYLVARIARQRR
jgi:ribosomal protein S25